MRRRWKRAAAGGLAAAGSVFVLLAVIAPRFVDFGAVRDKLTREASARLGGAVTVDAIRFALLPSPHFVLDGARVEFPGQLQAHLPSVSAYPRLLGLLSGRIELAALRLNSPDVHVQLARAASSPSPAATPMSVAALKPAVAAAVQAVSSLANTYAPGLVIAVNGGTLRLSGAQDEDLTFADLRVRATLAATRLTLQVTGASTLWEHMSLDGWVDPHKLDAGARIELNRLRPHLLAAARSFASVQVDDSEVNLAVHAETSGFDSLDVAVDGSTPALGLRRGTTSLQLKGDAISATAHVAQQSMEVHVRDVRLSSPRLQLSGSFAWNQATPTVNLEAQAQNVDVTAAHDAVTFLAGDAGVIGTIFDVLRGGTVPQISFHARGATPADLGSAAAIVIGGQLASGSVHVPGIDLDLSDVSGAVTVENGVLQGHQLAAHHGRVVASDGTLQLGLAGEAPVLGVEADVHADVAELPALLRQVAPQDAVAPVLDQIRTLEGSATGHLSLGGTTRDVSTKVTVSQVTLSAEVVGVEPRLQLDGGRIAYEGRQIAATDVRVTAGSSTLSQLAARLDWGETPARLDLSAGTSRLALQEIHRWLLASGWLREWKWAPKTVAGTLAMETLHIDGPVASPIAWRFDIAGAGQDIDIESPLLQEHIALRYPVTLAGIRIIRDPARDTSLSGTVAAPNGFTGAVDIAWNADALTIKRLTVRDARSNLSLSLVNRRTETSLSFSGELHKSTVNVLMPENHHLAGWLRGDFRARVVSDDPTQSSFDGQLEASDVVFGEGDTQAHLQQLSLTGSGGLVSGDAAIDLASEHHVSVHGSARPAGKTLVLDLDVIADDFDWRHLEPWFQGQERPTSTGTGAEQPSLLRGRIRISAQAFTYRDFTWKPLHATVTLNPTGPVVDVTQAAVCGINTPGRIAVTPQGLRLTFKLLSVKQPVDAAITCLANKPGLAVGQYDIHGDISAAGAAARLVESLRGHVEVAARRGRIYQGGILAKVLSALSVTGGNIPDITAEGFAYDSLALKGDMQGGSLALSEGVVDGPSAKIVCQGTVDLVRQKIELTLLVAPLKTVDAVVSRIPLVGGILGNTFISIPVKVSGDLANPEVTTLPPAAVGQGLVGIMERTLELPFKVIEPVLPRSKR